jgi:hypothetical protein
VIAIAEKNTRMEVLGDSLGLGYIKIILSCLIRRNRSHYFLYRIQQEIQNINGHQGGSHFLRISGYDARSRLEIVGKETITDEEIRTNYITLPHFVTLKDEIMRTLQK